LQAPGRTSPCACFLQEREQVGFLPGSPPRRLTGDPLRAPSELLEKLAEMIPPPRGHLSSAAHLGRQRGGWAAPG
jgi:hypothetical protein